MIAARWRIILGTLLTVMLVTGALTYASPKTWTSSTDVYIDYRENDPLGGRNFSPILDDSYMQTQIDMIKSVAVAQQIIENLKLRETDKFREAAQRNGEPRAREALVAAVIKNTEVVNKRGSRLLEVGYTADSAVLAKDAATAIVDSYIGLTQQLASKAARSRSGQYNVQLEQLRKEADVIQENITKYQRDTGILKSSEDDIDVRKLNQMELDLSQLTARRQEAQARGGNSAALLSSGIRADDLPEIAQSGTVQDLRSKLNDVERRLTEARGSFGEQHPTVLGLVSERQELRSRLDRTSRAALDSQRSDQSRLSSQVSSLMSDIATQRQKVIKQLQNRDTLLSYERQLASVQQIYNAALQKYDGLLMASNITPPSITVMRAAEVPSRQSGPKWLRNMLSALLVGLGAGIFLALALELAHRRVRGREDLLRGIELPLLGTIGRNSSGAWA